MFHYNRKFICMLYFLAYSTWFFCWQHHNSYFPKIILVQISFSIVIRSLVYVPNHDRDTNSFVTKATHVANLPIFQYFSCWNPFNRNFQFHRSDIFLSNNSVGNNIKLTEFHLQMVFTKCLFNWALHLIECQIIGLLQYIVSVITGA